MLNAALCIILLLITSSDVQILRSVLACMDQLLNTSQPSSGDMDYARSLQTATNKIIVVVAVKCTLTLVQVTATILMFKRLDLRRRCQKYHLFWLIVVFTMATHVSSFIARDDIDFSLLVQTIPFSYDIEGTNLSLQNQANQ